MTDRPILFSARMVRSILAGTKTQTRRIVKIPEWVYEEHYGPIGSGTLLANIDCPFGKPGDRLWVRETCIPHEQGYVTYAADCLVDPVEDRKHGVRWTPSIHMPRWASRITLEITGVRVERLNEISEADAKAEGIEQLGIGWKDYGRPDFQEFGLDRPQSSFASLWSSINGRESWDANPWVWCIEFKRITP